MPLSPPSPSETHNANPPPHNSRLSGRFLSNCVRRCCRHVPVSRCQKESHQNEGRARRADERCMSTTAARDGRRRPVLDAARNCLRTFRGREKKERAPALPASAGEAAKKLSGQLWPASRPSPPTPPTTLSLPVSFLFSLPFSLVNEDVRRKALHPCPAVVQDSLDRCRRRLRRPRARVPRLHHGRDQQVGGVPCQGRSAAAIPSLADALADSELPCSSSSFPSARSPPLRPPPASTSPRPTPSWPTVSPACLNLCITNPPISRRGRAICSSPLHMKKHKLSLSKSSMSTGFSWSVVAPLSLNPPITPRPCPAFAARFRRLAL